MKDTFAKRAQLFVVLLAALAFAFIAGCSDDDGGTNGTGPGDDDGSFTYLFDDAIQAGDSLHLTADKKWLLSGFVFVEEDAVISIEPGTIIRARPGEGISASALIIARGGRIWANGTKDNPIIFTAQNDDIEDPTDIPLFSNGLWGGVIILGKATINDPAGVNQIEGIPSDEIRGEYGGNDDNDFSGEMRYVSIRHGGSEIGAANEINGLTLGAVGSQTVIEYVEVYSNYDDGVEFFGGTVNTKNIVVAFCGDDGFDYDEGFRGHGQFWFCIQQSDAGNHAGEHDGATGNEQGMPYARPIISNATYIGCGAGSGNPDNYAAIIMRDNAGGEYHNSIFSGFDMGLVIEDVVDEQTEDSRKRLEAGEIRFMNNLWYGFSSGNTPEAIWDQAGQEYCYDHMVLSANSNVVADPQFNAISRTNNAGLDPRPSSLGLAAGDAVIPEDAFFSQVSYKGAFDPSGESWLKGWTALDHYGFLQ